MHRRRTGGNPARSGAASDRRSSLPHLHQPRGDNPGRGTYASPVAIDEREGERRTDSGIEIRRCYAAEDLKDFDSSTELGEPGAYPYTRGIHPDMYRGRLWTMLQYAGFG